jgi:hypothetical protein
MTPVQRVCKKIKDKKPFKVRNTESNFKIVMKACQGKVRWCDGNSPLSVLYTTYVNSPYICVDFWGAVYCIAVPESPWEQTQPEITL